jgi:hypothetical protein
MNRGTSTERTTRKADDKRKKLLQKEQQVKLRQMVALKENHISEDVTLHSPCCENLKSNSVKLLLKLKKNMSVQFPHFGNNKSN